MQVRRQIGYIFQSHNLLGFLTVRQNVQMSVELNNDIFQREAETRAEAMLQAAGLADRVNYYPEKLARGQKQRVALAQVGAFPPNPQRVPRVPIARALVNHPKLVVADKPTAALDKKSGRDVVELMQRLAKEQGCTILMVTSRQSYFRYCRPHC